ncbi:MAG: DNA helicase UvrD [Pseudomonas sp. PGPPP3]|nr:MAG: DNA helicase UvrD [Pseudomonas sp. PGPPP3]
MLSAVERYQLRLRAALARYFPRTTAYLRAEREAASTIAQASLAPPRRQKQPRQPKRATQGQPQTSRKPSGAKPASKKAKSAIYGPTLLPVTPAQSQAMRERVGAAVQVGLLSPPSDEQWAMILTRQPLSRIFAGAGSGKSTTLVLRVVFMLCHVGIAPTQLTVISFTNASCAQLREQLLKLLAFWGYDFSANQARQCVRTFHSAMGVLAKSELGNPQWFEQLAERPTARELDNPLTGGRLRPAQQRLLIEAYQQCYAEQPTFRQQVHRLLALPPANETGSQPGPAPLQGFKLAGEFSALPLYEAIYAQAGFCQSIGIRLDQLQPAQLSCAPGERLFVEALLQFWAYFQRGLQAQGLQTFDGAFQCLTERLTADESSIGLEALAPLSHLLIDEFQDISPQIVLWLQAVQRSLARRGQTVSLMAIGDDWQSIYAWRGSSPELFIDYDRHFPGKGQAKHSEVLNLSNNYRSIEAVIRDGEAVLAAVACKQVKASHACKPTQTGDHGVKLIEDFDLNRQLPELLTQIQAQCAYAGERQSREPTAVLLLSRRNAPLQQIQARLDKRLAVKAYSIHRAKGLQAEVAIIIDDGSPAPAHPLRNALYAASGFFTSSYDQAMADENLHLAYVAITRGVSRVFWYTAKTQGASQLLAAHLRKLR